MGPSKYWIKLYHEILHDPKMGRLPDNLWRRTIELFLMAGELDQDGELPPVSDMAWTLRTSEQELEQELEALAASGLEIVTLTPTGWVVTRFTDRQSAMTSAERTRRHRESKRKEEYYGDETEQQQECNDDVTDRPTDSDRDTDSDTEREGASPARADSRDPTDLPEAEVQAAVLFAGSSAGVADPSQDGERWMNYKGPALRAYKELTGLYPDKQVGKPAIGNLAGEPDFDLQKWRSSIETCKLGGVNPRNIACMIDTYHAGGDYGEMLRQRKNGGKHGPNQRPGTATGAKRDTLSDEQRRLLEGYRRTDAPP